jgi:hypothetical protein
MASFPRADSSGETEIRVVRIETNVVPVPIIGLQQSTSFGVVTSESKQKTFLTDENRHPAKTVWPDRPGR